MPLHPRAEAHAQPSPTGPEAGPSSPAPAVIVRARPSEPSAARLTAARAFLAPGRREGDARGSFGPSGPFDQARDRAATRPQEAYR
ncbi:hypothetical protein [Streptosporangium sp. NBC_01756]|uniref:hypothetical protein n=1 Tax=Streptosporangium sp. NBC_01756 TaxID=2975950 RepID=UPI002DDC5AB3|nr:hypothetical protein [Streptosporangium sp. NBC_01756]WSC86075.1 hypothetical protein OIE48_37890 [Streptosporangium sp. NBC_01756]